MCCAKMMRGVEVNCSTHARHAGTAGLETNRERPSVRESDEKYT